jgi:hypothetical protein
MDIETRSNEFNLRKAFLTSLAVRKPLALATGTDLVSTKPVSVIPVRSSLGVARQIFIEACGGFAGAHPTVDTFHCAL